MANAFFLVLEGLDGSGKTGVTRALARTLQQSHGDNVRLTFEPHDPSNAGLFIRQILTKRVRVQPRTLALAFALNRADHNERVIDPFLSAEHRVLICDRYYLSSLVYQSVPPLTFADVWTLNEGARRPDLTLFLDASPQTCYERMSKRPEDRELFERNLDATRQTYAEAIVFLRAKGDAIVEIDANPSFDAVLQAALDAIQTHGPDWLRVGPPVAPVSPPEPASAETSVPLSVRSFIARALTPRSDPPLALLQNAVNTLSSASLGHLVIDYFREIGYSVGEPMAGIDADTRLLRYALPLGVEQRGLLLLLDGDNGDQGIDTATRTLLALLDSTDPNATARLIDFVIVLDGSRLGSFGDAYERTTSAGRLSPSVRILRRADLPGLLLTLTTTDNSPRNHPPS